MIPAKTVESLSADMGAGLAGWIGLESGRHRGDDVGLDLGLGRDAFRGAHGDVDGGAVDFVAIAIEKVVTDFRGGDFADSGVGARV